MRLQTRLGRLERQAPPLTRTHGSGEASDQYYSRAFTVSLEMVLNRSLSGQGLTT